MPVGSAGKGISDWTCPSEKDLTFTCKNMTLASGFGLSLQQKGCCGKKLNTVLFQ